MAAQALLLLALMSTGYTAHAADVSGAAQAMLTGRWAWTGFTGQCREVLDYRADGVVLVTSAQASREARYRLAHGADAQGFFKIEETTTRANGLADCAGDVRSFASNPGTAAGEPQQTSSYYVQFSPARDQMLVCKDASLKACFGPLKRQP